MNITITLELNQARRTVLALRKASMHNSEVSVNLGIKNFVDVDHQIAENISQQIRNQETKGQQNETVNQAGHPASAAGA